MYLHHFVYHFLFSGPKPPEFQQPTTQPPSTLFLTSPPTTASSYSSKSASPSKKSKHEAPSNSVPSCSDINTKSKTNLHSFQSTKSGCELPVSVDAWTKYHILSTKFENSFLNGDCKASQRKLTFGRRCLNSWRF